MAPYPATSRYPVGTRIHVEFDAVVTDESKLHELATTAVRADDGYNHLLFLDDSHITILAPKEWPPVAGDVWERKSDGERLFARKSSSGATRLVPATSYGDVIYVSDIRTADASKYKLVMPSKTRSAKSKTGGTLTPTPPYYCGDASCPVCLSASRAMLSRSVMAGSGLAGSY